jgi:acetyl-CoA carboxylase carboxyl transferase subunit alpha
MMALEFEKPLRELERKIEDLKQHAKGGGVDLGDEIHKLERKAKRLQVEIFNDLSPWQVVQLARHPERPYFLDYVGHLFTDFFELHGDRRFSDDASVVGGFARFPALDGAPVLLLGIHKGRNTEENMQRNFGMPFPEGYRKALRLVELAARFNRPVLTFIDTMGAYPGIGAEERGQAQAIAQCIEIMAGLPVPIVCTVIGEGGSGGALALGVGNRILMMQYSVYSVISPESCSSILYRDAGKAPKTAEALRLTAPDLQRFGVIDEIVPEPEGGAHRDPKRAAASLGAALERHLAALRLLTPRELIDDRYRRFREIGSFAQEQANGRLQ